LDSFITTTSKYFVQYEKLNAANNLLDQHLDRLNAKMRDLQFDLKEYLLDITAILYKAVQ
jgi:branched-subunit amino acid aminotransferase/4-amino-4-deoxychorismate lyase